MGGIYGSRAMSEEVFIRKAILVHGFKYSYVCCNYENSRSSVTIYCKSCREYIVQRAGAHIGGKGCYKCSIRNRVGKHGKTKSPLYIRWAAMRRRSKERGLRLYKPWDNFEIFEKYCIDNGWSAEYSICRGTPRNPDTGIYEPGNIYFDTNANNIRHALTKDWSFTNPDGIKVTFNNLNEFCRLNNLSSGGMCDLYHGKTDYCKGWTR